ncbi:hypothetical protein ACQKJC_22270 [Priestia koreensis]|uniref:hypothetical protein n=1 Tax=Priestia koreensis TaxID=284581 RepID=UPI003D062A97
MDTLFLLAFYLCMNVITDVKELKTYNYMHLGFFLLNLYFIHLFQLSYQSYFLVIGTALLLGIILEAARKLSPGDTKMFMVVSGYLFVGFPFISSLFIPIIFVGTYLICSALISLILLGLAYLKKIRGQEHIEIHIGTFHLEWKKRAGGQNTWSVPASPAILLATILFIALSV